jgi:hypothetical protein
LIYLTREAVPDTLLRSHVRACRLIVLHSHGASARPLRVEKPLARDGTTVTLEVQDVQSNYTVLNVDLTVAVSANNGVEVRWWTPWEVPRFRPG